MAHTTDDMAQNLMIGQWLDNAHDYVALIGHTPPVIYNIEICEGGKLL